MARILNKSLAAALLCSAIGLAGTAFAQAGASGAVDSEAKGAATNEAAGGSPTGSSIAVGGVHTGPGQIERSTGSEAATKNSGSTTANSNSSSYGASASATEEKPTFLSGVQSKSTPARGLKGTAMKRVDNDERKITAELNRASATSTGNANAASQASIGTGSNPNIQ